MMHFKKTVTILFLISIISFLNGCYSAILIAGEVIEPKFYGKEKEKKNANYTLKLHVFNTGINKVSSMFVGKNNPWRAVPAFVIEHSKYGLIVFDSGLSSNIFKKGKKALHPITRNFFKSRTLNGKDLPSQMRKSGLNPNKVNKIIYSHLHFDHIGNSDAFVNATFYTGKNTFNNRLKRINGFEPKFIENLKKTHIFKEVDFRNAKPYATFDKTIDLLGDDSILVIQGNGHLDGSIALLLKLPHGIVLLAGDEVVHFDWLNNNDIQKISKNKKQSANMRNRVRMLLKLDSNIIVFPGHDLSRAPNNRNDIVLHNKDLFYNQIWLK